MNMIILYFNHAYKIFLNVLKGVYNYFASSINMDNINILVICQFFFKKKIAQSKKILFISNYKRNL